MNIIDSIVLTPRAVQLWSETARQAVQRLRADGAIGEPGTEEAFALPDGSLSIECSLGQHRIVLKVPSSDWSHAN